MAKARYLYECGGCDHLHPLGWTGDCRDDSQRFTNDVLYLPSGGFDPDVYLMDEHAPIPPASVVPQEGIEVGCGNFDCVDCYRKAFDA